MAVRQITTRLAIDGEQEYKKQLAAVNRELGNLGAEMKLVDAQFKGQANSSEALRAKHNLLKQSIEQQVGKIGSLQGAVEEAAEAYGEADSRTDSYRRQLLSAETALAKLNDELSENDKLLKEAEDSADGCAKSIDGFGKAVKETADDADGLNDDLGGIGGALKGLRNEDGSFNLGGVTSALSNLKGLLVGGAIVTGAKAVKDAIFEIVESTEEYRESTGKLEVAFEQAGYSAEQAEAIFTRFYEVTGDTEASVTAANNLATLRLSFEDLKVMVDAVTGANILLGDSVPIDSLAESIADTVTLGKVTGNLADVLNRAGSNEDEFNELLASTNSAAERTNIIMSALSTGGMVEASNSFRETSADIIEMNRSQLELKQSMATLGEMLVPLATAWNEFSASVVNAIIAVIETAQRLVDKLNEIKINGNPQRNTSSENAAAYDQYLKDFARGYNGSHASGLNYVPFDGYRAELHMGEAVLNAQEAALWRSAARHGASGAPSASPPAPSPATALSAARCENVTIDVTLELDGQTLARKQYPLMQAEGRRRGTPLAGKEGT